jgi:hypothetical protein
VTADAGVDADKTSRCPPNQAADTGKPGDIQRAV